MLNTTKSARPAVGPVSKSRSLQVKVSIDGGDMAASRRLVYKIKSSLARTLEHEAGATLRVSTAGGRTPALPREPRLTKSDAPGCGAWWSF